jgi:hypothetical protein
MDAGPLELAHGMKDELGLDHSAECTGQSKAS